MKKIKRSNYKIVPWKNGLGYTELIDVQNSDFYSEKFSWRLSAATVNSPNLFSEYLNYRRWLTIWKGEGLLLNDFQLNQGMCYEFSGNDKIFCKNLSPNVIDLGLIYDTQKINAKMENFCLEKKTEIKLVGDVNYFFISHGKIKIGELELEDGDTLKFEQAQSLIVDLLSIEVKLIAISIHIVK